MKTVAALLLLTLCVSAYAASIQDILELRTYLEALQSQLDQEPGLTNAKALDDPKQGPTTSNGTGSSTSDGQSGSSDSSSECNWEEWVPPCDVMCADNDTCIPFNWMCDGVEDCVDGSDEILDRCMNTDCPSDHGRCTTGEMQGRCIPGAWFCDLWNDCGDASDEVSNIISGDACAQVNCSDGEDCKGEEGCLMKCGDFNTCVWKTWECDGWDDCGNNADEQNCPQKVWKRINARKASNHGVAATLRRTSPKRKMAELMRKWKK